MKFVEAKLTGSAVCCIHIYSNDRDRQPNQVQSTTGVCVFFSFDAHSCMQHTRTPFNEVTKKAAAAATIIFNHQKMTESQRTQFSPAAARDFVSVFVLLACTAFIFNQKLSSMSQDR